MGFDALRLLAAAALCLAAGALADAAGACARAWVGAALLAAVALLLAWPLARRRGPAPLPSGAPPPQAADARQLALLQAQLEHLPVAVWARAEGALTPLSSRARRLAAPA
jgi:hypothetical protein